jgi:hypothetical protein
MNSRLFPVILAALVSTLAAAPPDETPAPIYKIKLKFQAYDGDLKKLETMTFQVNALGIPVAPSFGKLGDPLTGTKWKIQAFEYKTRLNPDNNKEDVSELTIVHKVTQETKIIVLNSSVDVTNQ